MADPVLVLCANHCGAPRTPHRTSRYCLACRALLRRQPRSRVTPAQGAQLRALCGVVPQGEIQARLGLSKANITRWLREQGIQAGHYNAYPLAVREAVCATYEIGGTALVREQHPEVNVRCVVERRPGQETRHRPRQLRWTDAQLVEAVRMAGLVSHTAQARFFQRPNAFEGSIRALWAKRFRCPPRDVHGLPASLVWPIAQAGVLATLAPQQQAPGPHVVVLFLDLVTHLRPDVAPLIRQMVEALAAFQAWIFGTQDPNAIRHMMHEREAQYGRYSTESPSDNEWDPAAGDRKGSAASRP